VVEELEAEVAQRADARAEARAEARVEPRSPEPSDEHVEVAAPDESAIIEE